MKWKSKKWQVLFLLMCNQCCWLGGVGLETWDILNLSISTHLLSPHFPTCLPFLSVFNIPHDCFWAQGLFAISQLSEPAGLTGGSWMISWWSRLCCMWIPGKRPLESLETFSCLGWASCPVAASQVTLLGFRLTLTSPSLCLAAHFIHPQLFVGWESLNISRSFLIPSQNNVAILLVPCVVFIPFAYREKLAGFSHWTGLSYKVVGLGDGGLLQPENLTNVANKIELWLATFDLLFHL